MQTLADVAFTAQDEATVRGMFDSAARYIKAGDWSSWAGQYSENGFLQPSNGPTIRGRPNLLAWGQAFPQIKDFSFDNVEIWGEGNLAYGTSAYALKLKDLASDTGKQLVVFRRVSGGAWKVVAASYSSDLPIPDASGKE